VSTLAVKTFMNEILKFSQKQLFHLRLLNIKNVFTICASFSIGELDDNLAFAKRVTKRRRIGDFKQFKVAIFGCPLLMDNCNLNQYCLFGCDELGQD